MNAIRTSVLHVAPRRPHFLARAATIGALTALGLAVLPACTSQQAAPASYPGLPKAADVALVRYTSCGQALRNLRAAATAAVAQSRLGVGYGAAEGAAPGAPSAPGASGQSRGADAPGGQGAPPQAAGAPSASGSGTSGSGSSGQASGAPAPGYYSGTNDAVAGVDEPDLVKTDGRRIVTVIGGVLRVVDAQTMQLTGVLDLSGWAGTAGAAPMNLLLGGNHALVLFDQADPLTGAPVPEVPGAAPGTESPQAQITGPELLLIDLSSATPRVMSQYTIDGTLVDARQLGSVARVIIHSAPRLYLPAGYGLSSQQ